MVMRQTAAACISMQPVPPKLSLEFTRFHQDVYTETGAGAATMVIDATDEDCAETGLGGSTDYTRKTDWGLIAPEFSAIWLHELRIQPPSKKPRLRGAFLALKASGRRPTSRAW